ncbi:DHA2 family efflux MFS transporter permease subunit [Glycomyces sp. TRM65418]|uniref:DHA2 family efflux MFS transporter permease subunit n=1 Tax=Glycomyces sp. TRM65418 TaxID=2867006 RepID=UPI001CE57B48|nr:DHA2 family efflux MFS transporter permease subunit [Glycomyces sp. TRM65418]MCC3761519.1 DHA2 family efflux MFS transporter permease subunit [Glycomyces sp. TRM65418]QZD55617.1 DHA2 family efflux MFS transporter permease subunit [Glycomyces sp. TRM65418]
MSSTGNDRLDAALLRLVGVILLGGVLGLLSSTMVTVGLDLLAAEFDASLATIGWASTGFLLAVTIAIPFTTWAVDRYGGRRMWLIGLALFAAASLAAGFAWDAGSLVAFRILQGFGAGILDPLVLILLARAAGPARAGRVMGLMGVVLSLGPVVGPIFGGAVLERLDWPWMFHLSVLIAAVVFALSSKVLPADPPREAEQSQPRLDVIGMALIGPGVAALILAASQSAEHSAFTVWQTLLPLAAGAVLLAVYAFRALQPGSHPLIDLRMFANPGFSASVTIMGLTGVVMYASLIALPLYYQQAHGSTVLAAGLLVAPFGLGGTVSMPLAGWISDRIGSRSLARAGAIVLLACAIGLTRLDTDTPLVWPVAATLTMGLASGFVSAPTMGSLYRTLPASRVAQGSSVLYMLNQLGGSIGIAVVALILSVATEAVGGFQGVYWFLAVVLAAILAATWFLPGDYPPSNAEPRVKSAAGAVQS